VAIISVSWHSPVQATVLTSNGDDMKRVRLTKAAEVWITLVGEASRAAGRRDVYFY
jgi:hypothetical protein